ncbi:MAG: uracil-DNA glycosylase [Anaerolineae bacterium]|nr:uracil-DNA glycosylase [Anaerolineae bacterium]
MGAAEMLKEIALQVSSCQRCVLKNTRKHAVPGEGPADAQVMLIGEGPGFHENEQGRPFVGAAGKYLDELLQKGGLSRSAVFITNVVKCRPPGNRDPLPDELTACSFYLDRQIEIINPLVIVTLGRFSMARYLPNAKISAVHGKPSWVKGRLIIPMYHPAAALHQPMLKTDLEKDFARLSEWINEARQSAMVAATPAEPPQNSGETPTQLSLFG